MGVVEVIRLSLKLRAIYLEQAITTNVMNNKIFKLPVLPLCRLCQSADKTIDHIISSCSYIAQSQYNKRHDLVASYIHWNLARLTELYSPIESSHLNFQELSQAHVSTTVHEHRILSDRKFPTT